MFDRLPETKPHALQRADVFSLPALGSLGHFEFNGLAFLQTAKATALNRGEMDENILAGLAADEAVALCVVKPLYCSLFHDVAVFPFNRFTLERFGGSAGRLLAVEAQELLTTDSF